eukprot:gene1981-5061_t
MAIVVCIGALAVSTNGDQCEESVNSTNWKKWTECRTAYAEKALTNNSGANAVSFTVGLLTIIGALYFIFYTGVGMTTMPLNMIRSRLSNKSDRIEVEHRIRMNQEKSEYKGKRNNRMSRRDQRLLEAAEHETDVLQRARSRADRIQSGCLSKLITVLRPFEFVFGIVFLLLSIFIVASLTMTAGDTLLQITQQHLNWKTGYSKAAPRILNPVDALMRIFQVGFPLDYIVLVLIIYYFLAATMSGVRSVGVRFCGLKIFDISRGRTVPQALLFLATIVTFTLLFVNVILLTLAPQYITYGNQKFPSVEPYNKTLENVQIRALSYSTAKLCDSEAPKYVYYVKNKTSQEMFQSNIGIYDEKENNRCLQEIITTKSNTTFDLKQNVFECTRRLACRSTRAAALLHAFFYNMWFLGLIYYWSNWGFILVFFLALVYLGCKRRRSLVASLVNDAKHDFHDSDEDTKPFNPSWL